MICCNWCLLTVNAEVSEMLCLWVGIDPEANRTEILQFSQESRTVYMLFINFTFIYDVLATLLELCIHCRFVSFIISQFPY
jgi:hypothetical protein